MSVMQQERGFTLIEVMIALFILGVGLLGMSALMTKSVQANQSAYHRTVALYIAEDIADRLRANRGTDYTSTITPTNNSCVVTSAATTLPSGCTSAQMAQWDAYDVSDITASPPKSLLSILPGYKLGLVTICKDDTPDDGTSPSSPACDGGTNTTVKIWWDEDRSGVIDVADPHVSVSLR